MTLDADIAIVGAGCAGLSLAVALADAHVPGRVLLLEPRETYTRDRTWCFWNTEPHPFEGAIAHRWNNWCVSSGERRAVQASRQYKYCHLPADRFYEAALARIAREPSIELCRNVEVTSITPDLVLETGKGRVAARRVFDSRPPVAHPQSGLLQRFLGWHVRTAEPCFDPRTVELMQFLPTSTPGRIAFMYVLPFAADEALVEATYLDDPTLPEPPYEPPYEQELTAWLRARASSWKILYTEHGSLPMGGLLLKEPDLPGHHRIGIAGGRLKPSSGYGFLRIQRHSRAIAHALKHGRPVPQGAESPLYGMLDAVFLRALRENPARGADLFLRMFERADPDALVRFLSENSLNLSEMAGVAWSLPKLPMAQAAFRSAW